MLVFVKPPSEEIEAVQGEPIAQVRPSEKTHNAHVVSQCYFELPTASNSIVLTLTQKSADRDAVNPKELWAETFRGEKKSPKEGDGEKKEKTPPRTIHGVGDEAFLHR